MSKVRLTTVGRYYHFYPATTSVVTVHTQGRDNAMPVAWNMPLSMEPPLFAVAISPRRYTHELIMQAREFAVNFVLDLYRPRDVGELPRPSFDSRLLGMMAEPGDIARSIADAFNYQFGFQVSSTWFYQLLQRWLIPIVVTALIAVLLLSSVVIVDAEELLGASGEE